MSDTPTSNSFGPSKGLMWIIGLLTAAVVGYMVERSVARGGLPGLGFGGGVMDWRQSTVAKVTLDTPCPLGPANIQFPADLVKVTTSREAYDGQVGGRERFHVGVIRATFRPHLPLDLDAGIDGALRAAAAKVGDRNPRFSKEHVTVAGLAARRGTYKTTYRGQNIRVDGVIAVRGSAAWIVVTTCDADKVTPAEIERVFASIDIAH
jgi:hypothetical protein